MNTSTVTQSVRLDPGTRYTKDGISIDVHEVTDGEVYCRRWPKGVDKQPAFSNCFRIPLAEFVEQAKAATMEDQSRL